MPLIPEIAGLLATSESPDLGPGPRAGVEPQNALTSELRRTLQDLNLSQERQDLIRALLLLWHDHLEAAHVIAQAIDNTDGAFVHGIVHRREPDYANAAYWFRRVGKHPAFPPLARRAADLLQSRRAGELREKLVPRGAWDPFAFVSACEAASGPSAAEIDRQLLRELQRIESEVLLELLLTQC